MNHNHNWCPTHNDLWAIKRGSLRESRFYFDQDGVLADFMFNARLKNLDSDAFKHTVGAYRDLPWMPNAQAGFNALLASPLDLWIATKIPGKNPHAATEKLLWIQEHCPVMLKRTTITPDKGLLGDKNDVLIDDRPHKAECKNFRGTFVHFDSPTMPDWIELMRWIAHVTDLPELEYVIKDLSLD